MTTITLDELLARRDEIALVDVRTPAEYRGERNNACDPRAGHIPGARNVDVAFIEGRTPAQIREELGVPEGALLVAY